MKFLVHLLVLWHKLHSKLRPEHPNHSGCQKTEGMDDTPRQVKFLNELILKVVRAQGLDDGDKLALILMIRKAISLRIR